MRPHAWLEFIYSFGFQPKIYSFGVCVCVCARARVYVCARARVRMITIEYGFLRVPLKGLRWYAAVRVGGLHHSVIHLMLEVLARSVWAIFHLCGITITVI